MGVGEEGERGLKERVAELGSVLAWAFGSLRFKTLPFPRKIYCSKSIPYEGRRGGRGVQAGTLNPSLAAILSLSCM